MAKKGIRLPAVVHKDMTEEQALAIVHGIHEAFKDTDEVLAMSFLLVSILTYAAERVPKHVLDSIYVYETSRAYGVPHSSLKRRQVRPHVRHRKN